MMAAVYGGMWATFASRPVSAAELTVSEKAGCILAGAGKRKNETYGLRRDDHVVIGIEKVRSVSGW